MPETHGQIEGYRFCRLLGSGGMGRVFLAIQESTQRPVAVKVLHPHLSKPEIERRFRLEKDVIANLNHPYIAQLIDTGVDNQNAAYLVMEYIDGTPLDTYLQGKVLTTKQRLELFEKICLGVQHAHQKGIIHRDLKPSNILITSNEGPAFPKIIDFGIAKVLSETSLPGLESRYAITTHAGPRKILGSLGYMSPEQALGRSEQVDIRTDIYALGILLFEILLGRPPFDLNPSAVPEIAYLYKLIRNDIQPPSVYWQKHLKQEPIHEAHATTRTRLINTFAKELDWVVIKASAKTVEHRYESTSALIGDVRAFLENRPISARPSTLAYTFRKAVSANPWLTSAAVFTVLALAFGLILSRQSLEVVKKSIQKEQQARQQLSQANQQLSQSLADAFFNQGISALKEEDYNLALANFGEALKNDPNHWAAKTHLFNLLTRGRFVTSRMRTSSTGNIHFKSVIHPTLDFIALNETSNIIDIYTLNHTAPVLVNSINVNRPGTFTWFNGKPNFVFSTENEIMIFNIHNSKALFSYSLPPRWYETMISPSDSFILLDTPYYWVALNDKLETVFKSLKPKIYPYKFKFSNDELFFSTYRGDSLSVYKLFKDPFRLENIFKTPLPGRRATNSPIAFTSEGFTAWHNKEVIKFNKNNKTLEKTTKTKYIHTVKISNQNKPFIQHDNTINPLQQSTDALITTSGAISYFDFLDSTLFTWEDELTISFYNQSTLEPSKPNVYLCSGVDQIQTTETKRICVTNFHGHQEIFEDNYIPFDDSKTSKGYPNQRKETILESFTSKNDYLIDNIEKNISKILTQKQDSIAFYHKFYTDNTCIFTIANYRTLFIHDTTSRATLKHFFTLPEITFDIYPKSGRSFIQYTSISPSLVHWKIDSENQLKRIQNIDLEHHFLNDSMSYFTPNGEKLITYSTRDDLVYIWDTYSGKLLKSLKTEKPPSFIDDIFTNTRGDFLAYRNNFGVAVLHELDHYTKVPLQFYPDQPIPTLNSFFISKKRLTFASPTENKTSPRFAEPPSEPAPPWISQVTSGISRLKLDSSGNFNLSDPSDEYYDQISALKSTQPGDTWAFHLKILFFGPEESTNFEKNNKTL